METLYSRKSTSGVKSSTTIQAPSSNHRNFPRQAWHWLPQGVVMPLLPLHRRHCSPCHRDACTQPVGPLTAARWYLFLIVETTREGIFFFFFRRLFMMDRFHLTHLLPSLPLTHTNPTPQQVHWHLHYRRDDRRSIFSRSRVRQRRRTNVDQ